MKKYEGTITVKFEGKPDVTRPISYDQVENDTDVLTLLKDEKSNKRVKDAINYAFGLWERSALRNKIVASEGGPDKAIEKAVKQLQAARIAMGKAELAPEVALAKAKAMLAED